MKKINKAKLDFIIDIIMFVVLMAIAGLGFLIKWVLVPGFKRNQVYGKDVELYFWGLDRHEWGSIHLILSFTLLFLLILHLIFHWRQILCIYRSMVSSRPVRSLLTVFLIFLTLILAIVPLFIHPEVDEYAAGHGREREHYPGRFHEERNIPPQSTIIEDKETGAEIQNDETPVGKTEAKRRETKMYESYEDIEVFGYMTLNEVSRKYNVPAEELAKCINVPVSMANERLGRLRKQYDFHMDDLRLFIAKRK